MFSAVLLTFNSEKSIRRTLASISQLTDDIHVVDSFSEDNTLAIAREYHAKIQQRAFKNYSDQRNWAIESLPLKYNWQLHVDADEELTEELQRHLASLDLSNSPVDGYLIGRKIVFMGKVLRFSSIAKTWHYRLFRTGAGRCEERLYDQHFLALGSTDKINAFMLDHQEADLSDWTAAHNRWSDMEAKEALSPPTSTEGQVKADARGNPIERRRAQKSRYYSLPLFWRAFGYAFQRYILQGGFLDGREGLIFHTLQAFWFRFLVDAKIHEAKLQQEIAQRAGNG